MIIGIDLGTTNSLAAYFTENGPQIIPNRLGKHLTPSVVSIDEKDQIYVGETAKERMLIFPESAAGIFKRDMGSHRKYTLGKKEFTAEELSSFILKALKEDAQAYLNEKVTEAVISVPAYFNNERRRATKHAGELAGLTVERIISEPTAAAVSYGLYQNKENAKFLVFDLGGGTFDVSILELFDSIIEVRAVAGDNFLGGEEFTQVLEQMFYEHKKIDKSSLSLKTLGYVHKQAEICKLGFSENRISKMICNINGEQVEYTVDTQEYEKNCEGLFEKMRQPIKRSLADANIRVADIDKVVLVGGGTKLWIVRKFVSKLFGIIPDTNINPDEAVALGAAIQGAMKERDKAVKEIILTDVCPFTLGTEVVLDRGNDRMENGHFCPIIERNTTIPASRTERLYTVKDNQTKIRINILQGESRFARNNLSLGELVIEVPAAKAGQEAVDVTYTYDINAILEVEVKIISTGKSVRKVIKSQYTQLDDEEIEKRLKEISYLKIHPRDKEENKLLLLKGEGLYEESIGMDRIRIEKALQKFEDALNTQNYTIIEGAKKEYKEFLKEMEEQE